MIPTVVRIEINAAARSNQVTIACSTCCLRRRRATRSRIAWFISSSGFVDILLDIAVSNLKISGSGATSRGRCRVTLKRQPVCCAAIQGCTQIVNSALLPGTSPLSSVQFVKLRLVLAVGEADVPDLFGKFSSIVQIKPYERLHVLVFE